MIRQEREKSPRKEPTTKRILRKGRGVKVSRATVKEMIEQASMRPKLQAAYQELTYERAKEKLSKIRKELQLINPLAANSLDEGIEETLTLHPLGLVRELGISFKTTNCIES